MRDKLTAWFPLLLLATLAALTYWLDHAVQMPAGSRNELTRHDPDYIAVNLSAMSMAVDGGIKNTLFATKMIHYPDDDSTFLQEPRLVSYSSGKAPITITSREALMSKDGNTVDFQNDVRVSRAAYDDKSELVMRTSYLHVIPDDKIAETDRPVTITDANTVVNAVGLELDGKTHILKLKSRVKGIYDQHKK
jgi:lipopolysaccharide export system protein LptC